MFNKNAIKQEGLTLPSVEGCFGTLDILREPPKSIHTYYKPKVSDTNSITEQIDASGDRMCEFINKFARGVNPMVSVSYSNAGSNGGQMAGTTYDQRSIGSASSQAYLPYRIMKDGAFRPPVSAPQDLLPLSRQSHAPFSVSTNPGSEVSISNTINQYTCSTDMKSIRQNLLQVCAKPTLSFNISKPEKPSNIRALLKDRCTMNVSTSKSDKCTYGTLGIYPDAKNGVKRQENVLYGSFSTNLKSLLSGPAIVANKSVAA
jgi:hypothetical protein